MATGGKPVAEGKIVYTIVSTIAASEERDENLFSFSPSADAISSGAI